MKNYKNIIIGSGPAGMTCALYLSRANQEVLIIEKAAPGGTLLKLKNIENYMGFEAISGPDLAIKMYKQIKNNKIPLEIDEVKNITKTNENFIIHTTKTKYSCQNIIIATGRTTNFPLDNGKINGISYCAICDGTLYKDKIVAVYGNEGVYNDANYLKDICKKIYIITNETIKPIKNAEIIKGKITKIETKNQTISSITVNNKKYNIEGLFISSSTPTNLNLKQKAGYIETNEKMQTTTKGIYAIGDIRHKDYYQITTATNDGLIAALNIKKGE